MATIHNATPMPESLRLRVQALFPKIFPDLMRARKGQPAFIAGVLATGPYLMPRPWEDMIRSGGTMLELPQEE